MGRLDGSKHDERGRRVFAASEARASGHGGIAATSEITGIARAAIGRGLKVSTCRRRRKDGCAVKAAALGY